MNYKLQIISLIFSFIFGIFFYIVSLFHYKMIRNIPIIFKYLFTFLFMSIISFLYVLLMYKVNYGVIHIYFMIVLFIGYFSSYIYVKKFRKMCKVLKRRLNVK